MRNAAHDELVSQIIESVQVLQNQAELPHQPRVLEVPLQVRVELGDEEGIVAGECGDEGRVDGEVIFWRMAAPACPPVPLERLLEEDLPAPGVIPYRSIPACFLLQNGAAPF